MRTDNKPWKDGCRVIKFTSGILSPLPYRAAEGWIDYKSPMSESAGRANEAIRKMINSKN